MFESALNFKFQRAGPPTPQQISEASAAYAAKKLGQVNSEVVQYFVPFARQLLAQTQSASGQGHTPAKRQTDDEDSLLGQVGTPLLSPYF